ncbi:MULTISPECIES: hypothetical protein [Paraburkholderia]|uniref:hypothetical protein n=1 Tax=Paraburkholderia TaxID=1822464 RepID=UPI00321853EB
MRTLALPRVMALVRGLLVSAWTRTFARAGMRARPPRQPLRSLAPALAAALMLCACIDSGGIRPRESLLDPATLDPGVALRDTQADAKWPDDGWWRQWNDPQLDTLVRDATAGNPGLRAVEARVDAAAFQASMHGEKHFQRELDREGSGAADGVSGSGRSCDPAAGLPRRRCRVRACR